MWIEYQAGYQEGERAGIEKGLEKADRQIEERTGISVQQWKIIQDEYNRKLTTIKVNHGL